MPRASVASPPRGLRFGDHHRSRGGALRGEVVNGVEGRAELAEQAALRHTPPPGEFGRRDAVERQRHATRPATSATIPTSIAPLRRRLVPWVRPVNNRLATASTTSWANRAMRKYAPWYCASAGNASDNGTKAAASPAATRLARRAPRTSGRVRRPSVRSPA